MKRSVLSLVMVLIMLCAFVPCINAAEIVASGECGMWGDNVTWVLDSVGTLTISGEGDMKNYFSSPFDNTSDIKSVVIESGVTNIGNSVFDNCSDLTSITIPDSITRIGNYAFDNCRNLTSITIPNSVTSIGEYAFFYCSSWTSITIPNSVTSIGESAFEGTGYYDNDTNWENGVLYIDNHLIKAKSYIINSEYIINNSTKTIADCAFWNCYDLTSITIPNSVTSVGDNAFYYCRGLTSITIPDSVTSIGERAFEDCSGLTNATIGNGVTSIGTYAFSGCSSLTSIAIGKNTTEIGLWVFKDCNIKTVYYNAQQYFSVFGNNLREIHLGDNVKLIPENAFTDTVYYKDDTNWENGLLYIDNCLVAAKSDIIECKIKDNCKVIANSIFKNCSSLDSVYISDIAAYLNIEFGTSKSNPMYYANKLYINNKRVTSIEIPKGVKQIPVYAFNGCDGLKKITIPNSVTSIGDNAFSDCSGLASITIPSSVTSVGDNAFSNCSGLTSITIPNSVTNIGDRAFSGCSGLTSVTIPNSVTSIGNDAFRNCSNITKINYDAQKVFSNIFNSNYNTLLIVLGNNVTTIDSNAFSGCSYLKRILIPKTVTEIEKSAFSECDNLTAIEYGGSQSDWEELYIGADNENLTNAKITYNSSLTNTMLTDLDYLTYIKNDDNTITITDCNTAVTNINIPKEIDGLTVTAIGSKVFYNCSKLTTITIPNSIKSIGSSAFSGCNNLKDVYYTGAETQWKAIDLGYSNSALTDANINYNCVAPKPTQKPTPIPTTTATVTKSETNTTYDFNVTPEATYENCYVYVVIYDDNGALLAVNRVPLALAGSTSISVNKSANDVIAKVFIWADTLQPIITAEEFDLI